ncbi:MAG: methyl-accepting chemotaxis protein [Terracidiphilus sp.]|jgi:methyl-accepting chemotaxis protein
MRALRISHTIYLLLGFALFAGGSASTYLMIRCAGVSTGYTAIIQGEIAQAQQVRVLQLNFKKQVQAWKDILLRGKDDAALSKYGTEFHSLAARVQADSATLATQIRDEQARATLGSFQQQHQLLDSQYEAALAGYTANRDFAQADTAVKGKDRPPTDTLDQVVGRLTGMAASLPAEEAARLNHEQTLLIALLASIWVLLGALSIAFARSLGFRMDHCVQFVRQIAAGDLTFAVPEQGRGDELGMLVDAMSQMCDQLRKMVGNIQSVAGALSLNAESVSSSSVQIAAASSEQRNQTSQVAAALEEMIASVREVTTHCHEAAKNAVQTGSLATGSCQSVEAVASEVRDISTEAQSNAKTVHELGERSGQISNIVNLIQEIAGQTNLLALNAAIESARAGEHGRGFAVVAGEVRRLAERTTSATKEIADAVQSIQQGTRDAVEHIKNSSERVEKSVLSADAAVLSLGALGSGTAEVRQLIEQIAQAAEEQSQASALVGQSMNEISLSINASSEGAEVSARTASELVNLARQLNEQISRFNIGEQKREPFLVSRSRAA